jgi:hypothetical protein
MIKRLHLENEFNKLLKEHEFMVKFRGDNEITLIGAPTNNFVSRCIMSFGGIILVSYCLIQASKHESTLVIGGALLGLIFAATPFLSFYSKKYFKILFSRQLKQINIMNGAIGPYKRIDFSNIDHFQFKRVEVDDFVSPDLEIPVTYKYALIAKTNGKEVALFSIDSDTRDIEEFTNKFGEFLSDFTDISVLA